MDDRQRALRLDPNWFDALAEFGTIVRQQDRVGDAAQTHGRARHPLWRTRMHGRIKANANKLNMKQILREQEEFSAALVRQVQEPPSLSHFPFKSAKRRRSLKNPVGGRRIRFMCSS